MSISEIRAVFEMLDKDKTSSISAEEFLALCDLLIVRYLVRYYCTAIYYYKTMLSMRYSVRTPLALSPLAARAG